MKIKVFIDQSIAENITCLFDKTKTLTVKSNQEADISLLKPTDTPDSYPENAVIFVKTHKLIVSSNYFISPLICPYSHNIIGALTNNDKVLQILTSKIYVKKTTRTEAKLMISYWKDATLFFGTLVSLHQSLMRSVNINEPLKMKKGLYECTKSSSAL